MAAEVRIADALKGTYIEGLLHDEKIIGLGNSITSINRSLFLTGYEPGLTLHPSIFLTVPADLDQRHPRFCT